MKICLKKFYYFFMATGRDGGLFSTSWTFEPVPGEDDGYADAMTAIEDGTVFHRNLIDRTVDGKLRGQWGDTLIDAPGEREFGFKYDGKLAGGWVLSAVSHCLGKLFGHPPVFGQLSAFYPCSASVTCTRRNFNLNGQSVTMEVEHRLGHAINVALFQHLRTMDSIVISPDAAPELVRLEEVLEMIERGQGLSSYLVNPSR